MSDTFFSPLLRRSVVVAVSINCVMVLTGTMANLVRSWHWLSWIARGIATPPGLFLRYFLRPNAQSVASYAVTAVIGICCSVIFYTLVAWGVFWLLARRRPAKTPDHAA